MQIYRPYKPKHNWFQWIGLICRILFGLTFMFSGFVKAIDPLGFSYKQQDYLEVWNLALTDPNEYSSKLIAHHAEISAFGGMFLLLVFLNFIFDM